MNILNINIRNNQSRLNISQSRRASTCFALFFVVLVLLSTNFALQAEEENAAPQENQEEMTYEKLYEEVNNIYKKLFNDQEKDSNDNLKASEKVKKCEEALKTGRQLQSEKRFQEAIQLYSETIGWYKSSNLFEEVNRIKNDLQQEQVNEDSKEFVKIKEAMKDGPNFEKEKRYQDAIQLYTETLNWYKQFKKMKSRLEKWEKITGKLSDQLTKETKTEWFELKEKLSKDKTNKWLTLCEQLSNKTKNKWLTELEKATTDERRIWIIWLLSLDSLIDYPDMAPCLDGVAIDKDDDAITIFSDMFSGSRREYGMFKESFEQYMETWQKLLSAHCLDKDVEQAIFDIIARQKDYFSNNLVTTRLRSKLRSEIKKWINLQIDSYDDFMQKNKREKQENKP